MNFTFGIITSEPESSRVDTIIKSIEDENIPNYEIIIVGGNNKIGKNIIHIPFDENQKRMWITKKKNIISNEAKYENIVFLHDYVCLVPGWYEGHLKFGDDFQVLMDRMTNTDGKRWRDWNLWDIPSGIKNRMIPYDITHLSKYMYISGAYWVAKKSVMLEFPLDENRVWGQGEDVVWSQDVRKKYHFKMNIHSEVKFLKYKQNVFGEMTQEDIEVAKKLS